MSKKKLRLSCGCPRKVSHGRKPKAVRNCIALKGQRREWARRRRNREKAPKQSAQPSIIQRYRGASHRP